MPPKAKKTTSKPKNQEEQREETLQAVVLTDSYEKGFTPFSLEKPRCLLPVANVPLIEYTLEFLANVGIKDIFLYAGAHEDQVEDYINNSRWMSSTSPFSRLTILRYPATSVGDAMRDLDQRDLITGDFVLVMGDLISNINLDTALSKHRARREKDPSAMMTMVLRKAAKDHRSKPRTRRPFFFIDPQQDRCLHYEEISKTDEGDRRFHLEPDLLNRPEVDIRGDLVDFNIDICTTEVLSLWSEKEFQSMRSSFLRGVLQDYEFNGKTIHTHIIEEGYATRVTSLRAYNAVSKDIISRWTYPFTPDCNLMRGHKYRLQKNKIYLEAGVVLARGSSVKARSILGKDTSIGDGSIISDSVLGRRCQIGKNVTIRNSYIWDDVVVGDNSKIISSIIANEAVIGRDCSLERGTLLSYRVRLSYNTTIPKNTHLTHTNPSPSASSPGLILSPPPSNSSLVGPQGAGSLYTPTISDSESAILSPSPSAISLASISTLNSSPSSPSLLPSSIGRRDSTSSIPSSAEGDIPTTGRKVKTTASFLTEATAAITDSILKKDDPDTVKLELLSHRLSYDASDAAMRDAIAKGIMGGVWELINPTASQTASAGESVEGDTGAAAAPPPAKEATASIFKTYAPLLAQLGIFDTKSEAKKDQVAVLKEIERSCAAGLKEGSGPGDRVLLFAVDTLHRDMDVLEDEGVLQWWDGSSCKGGDGEKEVRKLVEGYVQWVREAESESDSDEEETDEDGEDDE